MISSPNVSGEPHADHRPGVWAFGVGTVGFTVVFAAACLHLYVRWLIFGVQPLGDTGWDRIILVPVGVWCSVLAEILGLVLAVIGLFFRRGRAWASLGVLLAVVTALLAFDTFHRRSGTSAMTDDHIKTALKIERSPVDKVHQFLA